MVNMEMSLHKIHGVLSCSRLRTLFNRSPQVARLWNMPPSDPPLASANRRCMSVYRAPTKVDFFYDVISPYSWIAFEILLRYRQLWNLDIHFKPSYLAAITKETNNKYLESMTGGANKARYAFTDLQRVAEHCHVPLRIPESPFYLISVVGSLKQQRFLTAAHLRHPDVVEQLSRQLWYRIWSEDLDASKDASLMIVGRRAGLNEEEVNECLQLAEADEAMQQLRRTTSEAVEEGAFGLPYLLFHKGKDNVEGYFGSDRFHLIAHRLDLEWKGPIPDADGLTSLAEPLPPASSLFVDGEQFDELNKLLMMRSEHDQQEGKPTEK